ncbi:IS256 family transposase [Terasakiella pusilla]|uniref:IS256 family transposase n=1 Tax=Terasakiella pusilla TaxID=64973 RepID=UPI003AA8C646
MVIKKELLDELLASVDNPQDLMGEDGLLKQLKKALIERAMNAELDDHLGYAKGDPVGRNHGNSRNGHGRKTIVGDDGEMEIATPRDRDATFEPQIIKKGQRRFDGFDDKIISMYARGMSVNEIRGHLEEIYGVEVSKDLISTVTDAVMDEVRDWQNRPLDAVYPVIIFDALRVKIRDEGTVRNKAVYLALGFTMEGQKEVLGLWIEQTEGAKFWLRVMNDIKNRGVNDVFIAVVDGLKGFPEAINAVFPDTQVQTCIVHMIRNSLNFVGWKEKKAVATDLKEVYRAKTDEDAALKLDEFEEKWGTKFPSIAKSWRNNWEHVIPFFAYPEEIRKIIYTTNAIESLNMSLRKIIKNRGHFPNDEAATKLLYLALKNASKKWTIPTRTWKQALNQFAVLFEDRFPSSIY